MLLVGCTVRLHSLIARPELNDRRGIVVKSTDPTTDRAGVQVEGEIAPLAVRSRNLVALVVEASVSVFATLDLFRVVLTHVPRRVRAGHLSGVCKHWRATIWSHDDLYREVAQAAVAKAVGGVDTEVRRRLYGKATRPVKTFSCEFFRVDRTCVVSPSVCPVFFAN